jgi:hypothetical protein
LPALPWFPRVPALPWLPRVRAGIAKGSNPQGYPEHHDETRNPDFTGKGSDMKNRNIRLILLKEDHSRRDTEELNLRAGRSGRVADTDEVSISRPGQVDAGQDDGRAE